MSLQLRGIPEPEAAQRTGVLHYLLEFKINQSKSNNNKDDHL